MQADAPVGAVSLVSPAASGSSASARRLLGCDRLLTADGGRSAVGFFSTPQTDPLALLVCDECDRVLTLDGQLSEKALRDCSLDDLAPHFRPRGELAMPAMQAGWRGRIGPRYDHSHWLCPRCATDGGGDTARWRLVPKGVSRS